MTPVPITMKDLGEKGFLDDLLPTLPRSAHFVNGFGHDASVLDAGLGSCNLVMKIDRAAKPIAALNGWADYKIWGRLAVTANCSDILACGGRPIGVMAALCVPPTFLVEHARQIIEGVSEECSANDVAFLGGDTKESAYPELIGSAVGLVGRGQHVGRKAGKAGDLIVLAGMLGGFLGAYWDLSKHDRLHEEEAMRLVSYPKARWNEAIAMEKVQGRKSACDLSDGLLDALPNVVSENCGCILYSNSLPYHRLAALFARETNIDMFNTAIGVGDWGIVYTVDPRYFDEEAIVSNGGLELRVIGKVIDSPGITLQRDDIVFRVNGLRNEHFRQRMEDQGTYFDSIRGQVTLERI